LEAVQPSSDFDRAVEEVKRLETNEAPTQKRGAKTAAKKAIRSTRPKTGNDDQRGAGDAGVAGEAGGGHDNNTLQKGGALRA
jgi:hypothetical protein